MSFGQHLTSLLISCSQSLMLRNELTKAMMKPSVARNQHAASQLLRTKM